MGEENESIQAEDAMAPVSLEDEIGNFLDDTSAPEVVEEREGDEAPTPEVPPDTGDVPEGTESVGETVEVVEEEVIPPVVDEVTALREQVSSLTQLVDSLSAPKATTEVAVEPEIDLKELMDGADFDEIMEHKDKFMSFLGSVIKAASTATAKHVQGIVPQVVTQQTSLAEVRKQFYDTYPELGAVKQYVANVANTVAAEHPDWQVGQVLAEAAKVSKAALNIQAIPPVKPKVTPPVLPGGTQTSRRTPPSKSSLQSEIDELLDD